MKEIKFKVRNKNNGHFEVYTLSELALTCGLPENEDWTNVKLFTGCLDCNNREIWEGDTIRLAEDTFEVKFVRGMFCIEEDGGFFPISQFYSTCEVL